MPEAKILIVGIIQKDDSTLLRKKFPGSLPYKETWYSFGCDFQPDEDPRETYRSYLLEHVGIEVEVTRALSWNTEVKEDHDGETKRFVYLELECSYVSGDPRVPEGHESVRFVPQGELSSLDLVPPSVDMFRRAGYLPE